MNSIISLSYIDNYTDIPNYTANKPASNYLSGHSYLKKNYYKL